MESANQLSLIFIALLSHLIQIQSEKICYEQEIYLIGNLACDINCPECRIRQNGTVYAYHKLLNGTCDNWPGMVDCTNETNASTTKKPYSISPPQLSSTSTDQDDNTQNSSVPTTTTMPTPTNFPSSKSNASTKNQSWIIGVVLLSSISFLLCCAASFFLFMQRSFTHALQRMSPIESSHVCTCTNKN